MKLKKNWKKILVFGVILLIIIVTVNVKKAKEKAAAAGSLAEQLKTGTAERKTLQSSLDSDGTILAKDSYSITSMVEGEVLQCFFAEGDQVTKDQVMYVIDSSDYETKVSNSVNSLERARDNYEVAVRDYEKALSDYSGNTLKAGTSGYVKSIEIKAGEMVGTNTTILTLWDDSVMEITIPFLSMEAAMVTPGMPVVLTLSDTLEEILGTVVAVGTWDEAGNGGQLVRSVTITVNNPGGLKSTMTATGCIGGFASAGDGTFKPAKDLKLTVKGLKTSVQAAEILVHVGEHVNVGTPLVLMDSRDADDLIRSYKTSMDNAKNTLENAEANQVSNEKTLSNYTIKAPITGTVVSKKVNVGENITKNTSQQNVLATIYDLTEMTFEMSIDEMDITNVHVGQKVKVTADAFDGQTFDGEVTKVSLEGTASNGVTSYPVKVTVKEYGNLRPGMNVSGTIILEERENALSIPIDALQRGNLVYVKDTEGRTEDQGNVGRRQGNGDAKDPEKAQTAGQESGSGKETAAAGQGSSTGKETAAAGQGSSTGKETAAAETTAQAAGQESGKTETSDKSEGLIGGITKKVRQILGLEKTTEKKKSNVPDGYHAVRVVTGITTSDNVEILEGDIIEGDIVYVNQTTKGASTNRWGSGGMGGMGGNPGGMSGPPR